MASYVQFFVRFITVGSLSIQLCVGFTSSASSSCEHGTYKHNGMDCCLCGVGKRVVTHCSTSPTDGKCQPCNPGSYSSHPNDKDRCTRCTSCSQPNENLEDEEPCTVARDAKCRCKKDHYCVSSTDICRLCSLCRVCGPEGIKVPCKGNNNTVCNDQLEGGVQTGVIVGIVLGVLVLLALIAVYIWKKRPCSKTPPSGRPADVETQPMTEVDLRRHLPDIAEEIRWKDMQDIAIASNIPYATIDNIKRNHPVEEQTFQLLMTWVERQGQGASSELIRILRTRNKKSTADRVIEILNKAN